MARKGTAGKTPEKQVGARESGIDKAVNKVKETLDGENEATNYEEEKGRSEQQDAKEYSEKIADERPKNTRDI